MKAQLLTGLLLLGWTSSLGAQARSIEILEPAEWRSGQTRNIAVVQRRSVRVVGLVRHPSGITSVTINGERASLSRDGNAVRFVGYITAEAATREVIITARSGNGDRLDERFGLDVVPSETAYDDPTAAWSSEEFGGERWAVVVGISEYADSAVRPLRYADDDARAFYDFLISDRAGAGGFEPDHVQLLVDQEATTRNILVALRDFLKGATEEDVVVIFFAGHGAPDPDRPDDLYLLTHDTELRYLAGTAVPMEAVNDAVRRTYARTIISLTDACHSGGVGGQVGLRAAGYNPINEVFLDRIQSSTATLVSFTASEVNQFSQEDARWGGGHGVFTHFLLRGLGGEADEDGDRIVSLGELLEWTRSRVRRETRNAQVPTISQTSFDRSWPMAIVPAQHVDPVAARLAPVEPTTSGSIAVDRPRASSPESEAPLLLTDSAAMEAIGSFLANAVGRGDQAGLRTAIPEGLRETDPHNRLLRFAEDSGRRLETGELSLLEVTTGGDVSRVRFSTRLRWRSAFGGERRETFVFLAELVIGNGAWAVRSLQILEGSF